MSSSPSPFNVHQVHEVAIPVTASSLDSSSSIGTGSPTLLILESSLHDVHSSLGSSHGNLTVKFAPLPQLDSNRKRSLAPLGVPGRSRRKPAAQQEGGSILWSTDLDIPENLEDPIISFAKFISKTGKTLWRRVRGGSKVVLQGSDDAAYPVGPVLDIRSTAVCSGDEAVGEKGERVSRVVGLDSDKRGRRASWSPLAERRALDRGKAQRRSTGDLPHLSAAS